MTGPGDQVADLAGVAGYLDRLSQELAGHRDGTLRLPRAQVAGQALTALGVVAESVAGALGAGVDTLRDGLAQWAGQQRGQGRLTDERHAEVLRLAGVPR